MFVVTFILEAQVLVVGVVTQCRKMRCPGRLKRLYSATYSIVTDHSRVYKCVPIISNNFMFILKYKI